MKPKRKSQSKSVPAQVISLAAYRNAHRGVVSDPATEPVGVRGVSVMDAYCQWLALVGAAWAFWW